MGWSALLTFFRLYYPHVYIVNIFGNILPSSKMKCQNYCITEKCECQISYLKYEIVNFSWLKNSPFSLLTFYLIGKHCKAKTNDYFSKNSSIFFRVSKTAKMGCCEVLIKYIVFLFNFVFFLTSVALIGIGAYIQINMTKVINTLWRCT